MRIPTAHIDSELEAADRFDAIRQMLTRLVHAGAISRSAEPGIFTAFSRREEIISTGIGFRLAIPHVVSDVVLKPVVAFGRSRHGIEFDALDDVPVEFVFLFILPAGSLAVQTRLRLMARICRPLTKPLMQEKLRSCSTAQEISAVLENAHNDDDR